MLDRAYSEQHGGAHKALGGTRLVSYVRLDETGFVYRAAGWVPVQETPARDWRTVRRLVWPHVLEPATEPVARMGDPRVIGWEIDWTGRGDLHLRVTA